MGRGYYFFETPDYDNCLGKTWSATKLSLIGTGALAVWEVVHSQDETTKYMMGKALKTIVPFTAGIFIASSTTCAFANLRGKKDDTINYMVGGLATTPLWTACFKNSGYGVFMGLAWAAAGFWLKEAVRNDWILMPDHVEGDSTMNGSYGGQNWGDHRFPHQKFNYQDPGRRVV